jgi:hypothetical protein
MNIEFLNLLKSPQEGDEGRKEKNKGDEPIRVIIHVYIEISQGNSLYSYLNQTKMSFFFQKQRIGRQNRSCLEDWYQWVGENILKGCRRSNMVEILGTHV